MPQISSRLGLATALVALALAITSAPAQPQSQAAGRPFDLEHAIRLVRHQMQSEQPDFGGLDDLPAQVQQRIASHAIDDDALWTFYTAVGVATHSATGAVNVTEWVRQDPTARLPLLATMTAQVQVFAPTLRATYHTTSNWSGSAEVTETLRSMMGHLHGERSYAARDPQYHNLMTELMLATRTDSKAIADLVKEGVAAHPSNFQLAVIAANAFLPKWGGSAATFERWAQDVSAAYPPDERDATYARIYQQGFAAEFRGQLFERAKVEWPRLMRGLRDLVKRSPSTATLNRSLLLACLGGNRALSREVLLHPAFTYSGRYWVDIDVPGGAYEPCRSWAGS